MLKSEDAPVSVIIPCYQCSETIRRAVDSVVGQSMKPTEVILVDDYSGDDTLGLLYEIQAEQPQGWIKVVSLPENSGPGTARNSGWKIAMQPYIAFLDSDDAWHPKKVEIQYAYMDDNPDVVLSGHGHRLLDKAQNIAAWDVILGKGVSIQKWQLLISNRFITPSVMIKRDIKQRFIEKRRYMEDHMLWLQIICSGVPVIKLPVELAAIYKNSFGAAGLSSQLWSMELGDLKNYAELHSNKDINSFQLLALCALSLLKYLRRVFISWTGIKWVNK